MALIALDEVCLSLGGPLLLNQVRLQVESGERIGLVGRNGMGKSTLLRLLAGEIQPDRGNVARARGLTVAVLPQEAPDLTGTVFDVVAGATPHAEVWRRYLALTRQLEQDHASATLEEMDRLQHVLEQDGGWDAGHRVVTRCQQVGIDPEERYENLSGGGRRRAMLARALAADAQLLLLDEPTNHLDLPAIDRLETFMTEFDGSVVFVTHDRYFLQRVATRILDLDLGRLTSWPGDYHTYQQRKMALLENEAGQQAEFDRKLAEEEVWIRQGIQARRTRNEGRVRALEAMRLERRQRRQRVGQARMAIQEAERSGNLVAEARQVSYAWQGTPLIRDFSTILMRGDKVGIIGPNGCGKTTLLRLLLGDLAPHDGEVKLGTRLEVAYFDQLRRFPDPEMKLVDAIAHGRDRLTLQGRTRHVMGYLRDFLFSADQANCPIHVLSGGERNRLALARLFAMPSNLLVLDEPTNDLDTETLELMESLLVSYPGTVLVVSHDRIFLNNVVTSLLVFEEGGTIGEYPGGYDDWLRQRAAPLVPVAEVKVEKSRERTSRPVRLTFKEKQELAALPDRISQLEAEQSRLQELLADPEVYRQADGDTARQMVKRLEELESELLAAYGRWEMLDAMEG